MPTRARIPPAGGRGLGPRRELRPADLDGLSAPRARAGADGDQLRTRRSRSSSRRYASRPATTARSRAERWARSPRIPSRRPRPRPSPRSRPAAHAGRASRQEGRCTGGSSSAGHIRQASSCCRPSRRAISRRPSGSTTAPPRRAASDGKTAIKAYEAFLKLAPDDATRRRSERHHAAQGLRRTLRRRPRRHRDRHRDHARRRDARKRQRAARLRPGRRSGRGARERSVREAHHIVIELSAPGSMDDSAVGVLVRSARDTRYAAESPPSAARTPRPRRARTNRRRPPRAPRRRRGQRARTRPARLNRSRWYASRPGADSSAGRAGDS